MGCQCENQKDEFNDDLNKNNDNLEKGNNYNFDEKDEILDLSGEKGIDQYQLRDENFENYEDNENNDNKREQGGYDEQTLQNKNEKYSDYPQKMLELINKIRENPSYYADVIEDSIQNIIEVQNEDKDEVKSKIVYKKKVKVALVKGESAFREAAEKLRNMEALPPLEFKSDICIPLPENEEDIKNSSYLKEQVKILRETTNIDVFYKDLVKIPEVSALLMIVDDSKKNPGKKRNIVLNKDFKYIGINSKFIGKTFIAYFAFSR